MLAMRAPSFEEGAFLTLFFVLCLCRSSQAVHMGVERGAICVAPAIIVGLRCIHIIDHQARPRVHSEDCHRGEFSSARKEIAEKIGVLASRCRQAPPKKKRKKKRNWAVGGRGHLSSLRRWVS